GLLTESHGRDPRHEEKRGPFYKWEEPAARSSLRGTDQDLPEIRPITDARDTTTGRIGMKNFLLTAASLALLSSPALAENIGVSMAAFDDNFLTVLRNGMGDHAKELGNVTLQVEDAQNDVGKQQNQVDNFIASGVDAIIVNPVDTDATA